MTHDVFIGTKLSVPGLKTARDCFEPYVCAAAQWIIYAGPEVFEMCQKHTRRTGGRIQWDRWKQRFELLATADHFSDRVRGVILSAAQRMAEIEEAGVTTNVVDHFGLLYRDADGTYVSNRPGTLGYVEPGKEDS